MSRRSRIGFDRKVELAWLDVAAGCAADGLDDATLRTALTELLSGVVAGTGSRSARGKTVTVLNGIWGTRDPRCTGLRARAVAALPHCSPQERVAIHWAMTLAGYAFFSDVAALVGRQLALSEAFSLGLLTRRVAERWGDRSTVRRAAQRVVRSMADWGALTELESIGRYEGVAARTVVSGAVANLLVEAVLLDAEADTLLVNALPSHSALFPFHIDVSVAMLRNSRQFRIYRQGGGDDYVGLA